MHWSDTYPHELHANVLLLDGKIENWKTGGTKAEAEFWPFTTRWKVNRMRLVDYGQYESLDVGDYTVESKTWMVNNNQEHNDVFMAHASEWYRQWEHADDYKLGRAY
jgi:hypothetical protein